MCHMFIETDPVTPSLRVVLLYVLQHRRCKNKFCARSSLRSFRSSVHSQLPSLTKPLSLSFQSGFGANAQGSLVQVRPKSTCALFMASKWWSRFGFIDFLLHNWLGCSTQRSQNKVTVLRPKSTPHICLQRVGEKDYPCLTSSCFSLPDMLAISDPEVQLPTLTMNSDQLAGITSTSSEAPFSLSGIIKEFGMNIPDQPDQQQQQSTISVPAGTVPGQDQGFTIQLLPTTDQQQAPRDMLDNLRGFPQQQQQQQQQQQHQQQDLMQLINSQPAAAAPTEPHVVIVEQPASHKLRFRYECEGRGAGALQGATSSSEKKTFPKIQIRGYTGPAVVVVSCVTHDSDKPKAHPHMLVSPASVSSTLVP